MCIALVCNSASGKNSLRNRYIYISQFSFILFRAHYRPEPSLAFSRVYCAAERPDSSEEIVQCCNHGNTVRRVRACETAIRTDVCRDIVLKKPDFSGRACDYRQTLFFFIFSFFPPLFFTSTFCKQRTFLLCFWSRYDKLEKYVHVREDV